MVHVRMVLMTKCSHMKINYGIRCLEELVGLNGAVSALKWNKEKA